MHAVSDDRLTVTLVTIEGNMIILMKYINVVIADVLRVGAKSYSVLWTCSSTSCTFSSETAGDNAMPLQFVLAALVLATPSGKVLQDFSVSQTFLTHDVAL